MYVTSPLNFTLVATECNFVQKLKVNVELEYVSKSLTVTPSLGYCCEPLAEPGRDCGKQWLGSCLDYWSGVVRPKGRRIGKVEPLLWLRGVEGGVVIFVVGIRRFHQFVVLHIPNVQGKGVCDDQTKSL